ncbi:MAG: CBS domain-containing protein, partial [Elusimicrobiota bacterium]|nr:CBS domain-containing protein [Elusimicrobiota bacterium]
ISVEGEKFDISTMQVLDHQRVLDMKNGLLTRETRYKDAKGREFLYTSVRFFSMARPHTGAMRITLKLLKGDANLTAISRLDDSVYNSGGHMIPRRRHYNPVDISKTDSLTYREFQTNTHKHRIGYGSRKTINQNGTLKAQNRSIHEFSLKGRRQIIFTKIFSIYTSNDCRPGKIKKMVASEIKEAAAAGFDKLLAEHKESFSEKWTDADIIIEGSIQNQRAIRFNIYHLIIAARQEFASSSIGARTLSGQGYRGHIFWDTEIYIFPFFAFTQPDTARKMLLFRYHTLPQARDRAADRGFKGAMYPWESTVSGHEQTPRYAKMIDGSIGEVTTQDFEHHITADVAYSIYQYYKITGDIRFIYSYGAEIVFETARFWASRVEYSGDDGLYHIDNITGPDEFHVEVRDNAYTNYLAGWNLRYAAGLYDSLKDKKTIKKLASKLHITAKTAKQWRDIGDNIALPRSDKYKVINQFDGYMRKKDYRARNYDINFLPEIPRYYEYIGMEKTRLIKQPDVLALFNLFPEDFSLKEKKINYDYYIYRTIHKSSLSYCFHSILASEFNDRLRAYIFFRSAAFIDLENIAGNTAGGIHAASLGGLWQAVTTGFAGLRIREEGLTIKPKLPGTMKKITFTFYYRQQRFRLKVSNKKIMIKFTSPKNSEKEEELTVNGRKILLQGGKFKTINLEKEERIKMIYAEDIMKEKNFVTTGENTSLKKVGDLIINNKASSIPVVDGDNVLKGIISESTILESLSKKKNFPSLKASDIMEKNVITIDASDSLEKITEVFTEHPYRRLPVVRDNMVVGVITRKDIIADFLGGYY